VSVEPVTPPSPPAAPPTPPANAAAALNAPPAPPPPPPFWEGFQDANLKTAAEKSGFKTNEEAFAVAHKFTAFKDADVESLVALPKDAKPEALMPILERLGAPKDAAGYGLDKIEGVDKDLAGKASEWFKEAGLLPWQAALIAAKQMGDAKAEAETMVKEEAAAAAREDAALRLEWPGTEYTAKVELGKRAMRAAGITAETISYLESGAGYGAVMKMAAFFGSKMKESDFIEGDGRATQPKTILQKMYPNDVAKDRNG
jgi:hypothetical protein